MKSQKIILIFSIFCSTLFWGCPYESEIPLSNPNESLIDTLLTGSWYEISTNENEQISSVDIDIFNDHEYLIQLMMREKASITIQSYRAFETTINHHKILNLQEIGNSPKYLFYKYAILKDTLKIAAISKDSIKEKFRNREDLVKHFTKNIDNKNIFEEERSFIKKKKK